MVVPFYSPASTVGGAHSPHGHLFLGDILILAVLAGGMEHVRAVFVCIPVMTNGFGHLVMCFWLFVYFS